jgi:hypothetical protein
MSTLHWGPHAYLNKYNLTQGAVLSEASTTFADEFHTYGNLLYLYTQYNDIHHQLIHHLLLFRIGME